MRIACFKTAKYLDDTLAPAESSPVNSRVQMRALRQVVDLFPPPYIADNLSVLADAL